MAFNLWHDCLTEECKGKIREAFPDFIPPPMPKDVGQEPWEKPNEIDRIMRQTPKRIRRPV